jgi:hypothetical protein
VYQKRGILHPAIGVDLRGQYLRAVIRWFSDARLPAPLDRLAGYRKGTNSGAGRMTAGIDTETARVQPEVVPRAIDFVRR